MYMITICDVIKLKTSLAQFLQDIKIIILLDKQTKNKSKQFIAAFTILNVANENYGGMATQVLLWDYKLL